MSIDISSSPHVVAGKKSFHRSQSPSGQGPGFEKG
jgi:hypothetical protein